MSDLQIQEARHLADMEATILNHLAQEETEIYRSLFKNHPDAIYVLNLEGQIFNSNQSAECLCGYFLTELNQMDFTHLFLGDDKKKSIYYYEQTLQGSPHEFQATVIHKEGHPIDTHVTFIPIMAEGLVTGVNVIIKDITEYKLANEKLRKSEQNLVMAQRIARLGSFDWDLNANVVSGSTELYRIFGLKPEEFTYEAFLNHVHEEDYEYVKGEVEKSLRGMPYDIEFRIVRPDGEMRMLAGKAEVIYDEVGNPARFVGTNRDITEQRLAEEALQQSETKLQIIVENAHDLISIADVNGILEYASPSHEAILGYPSTYYMGKQCFNFFCPDDLPWLSKKFEQLVHEKQSVVGEYRRLHADGHWVMVEGKGVPVIGEDGTVEKVVVVARDISERKQTEDLLLQSEKLSIAGQLAAGIAHEIRNPLTAIKGFLQLMKHNKLENENHINLMLSEMERIEVILSELLVLAKPQAHHFVSQDLQVILQEVLMLINSQALLHNIQILLNGQCDLSPITCDPNQLKQVFVNFLKNAIEAMPSGGTIQIEVHQPQSDDKYVCVRIIDEGCGMPEGRVARLGEPFYTTKEKGTGLGMMVSKRIIESHCGKISIKSKLGVGTTIEVLLPLDHSEADSHIDMS